MLFVGRMCDVIQKYKNVSKFMQECCESVVVLRQFNMVIRVLIPTRSVASTHLWVPLLKSTGRSAPPESWPDGYYFMLFKKKYVFTIKWLPDGFTTLTLGWIPDYKFPPRTTTYRAIFDIIWGLHLSSSPSTPQFHAVDSIGVHKEMLVGVLHFSSIAIGA